MKFHKDIFAIEGDTITIGIRAKPEKDKANEEIIKKIARHFKVPMSAVHITSGRTSKKKTVLVEF
ncbi:DUF167 domain-containing protein [bacterium]|nr:DUF167 domain-containing protein [bacterium]MCI0566503.1 DUF167 domain-containing protein [bacterium]